MADFSDEQRNSQWPCNIGLVTSSLTVFPVSNRLPTIWPDLYSSQRFPNVQNDTALVLQSFLSLENSRRAWSPIVTTIGNRRALNKQQQGETHRPTLRGESYGH